MDQNWSSGANQRATRSDPFNLGYSIYQPGRKNSINGSSPGPNPVEQPQNSDQNRAKLNQNHAGKSNPFRIWNEDDTVNQNGDDDDDDDAINFKRRGYQGKKRENSELFVNRDSRQIPLNRIIALPRPKPAAMDTRFRYFDFDEDISDDTKDTENAIGAGCYLAIMVLIIILLLSIVASVIIVVLADQAQRTTGLYVARVNTTVTAQYIPQYGNPNSEEFQNFSTVFCLSMQNKVTSSEASYGGQYRDCVVDNIRRGSCIVNFRLWFSDKKKIDADNLKKDLNIQIENEPFSFLSFEIIQINKESTPSKTDTTMSSMPSITTDGTSKIDPTMSSMSVTTLDAPRNTDPIISSMSPTTSDGTSKIDPTMSSMPPSTPDGPSNTDSIMSSMSPTTQNGPRTIDPTMSSTISDGPSTIDPFMSSTISDGPSTIDPTMSSMSSTISDGPSTIDPTMSPTISDGPSTIDTIMSSMLSTILDGPSNTDPIISSMSPTTPDGTSKIDPTMSSMSVTTLDGPGNTDPIISSMSPTTSDGTSKTESTMSSITSTISDGPSTLNSTLPSMPPTISDGSSKIDSTMASLMETTSSPLDPSFTISSTTAAASSEHTSELTPSSSQSINPSNSTTIPVQPSVTTSPQFTDVFAVMKNLHIFHINMTSPFDCVVNLQQNYALQLTEMRISRNNEDGSINSTVISHDFTTNITTANDTAFSIQEIQINGTVTSVTFDYNTNSISNPDVCSVTGKYTCDFDVSDTSVEKFKASTEMAITGTPSDVGISTDSHYKVNTTGTVNCSANIDTMYGSHFIQLVLINGSSSLPFIDIMDQSNNTGRVSGFPTITLKSEIVSGQSDDCLQRKTIGYNVMFDEVYEYDLAVGCIAVDSANNKVINTDPVSFNVTNT